MIPVNPVPVSKTRESPAVLAFRSVTKAYGRFPLLDQVSQFQKDLINGFHAWRPV
jgi:hypothetical protein